MRYATVVKEVVFDSAHRNVGFGEGHKCANIHGHTFKAQVHVKALIDEKTGLSIDFGVIKKALKDFVVDVLDHKYLNVDVPYFKDTPPSAENIAYYIYEQVEREVRKENAHVEKVELWETPTSAVIITPDHIKPCIPTRMEGSNL